jgi:cysteine desulfurase
MPVHVCEVRPDGVVDPDRLLDLVDAAAASGEGPALVSVQAANGELGTVQPLDVIGPALADRGIALHVDAVQAFGRIPLDLDAWRPTAVALSAHKVGGPTGIGALVLRRDAEPHPVLHGGAQERGVRSGTLPVAAIVGFGAAATLALARLPQMAAVAAERDQLEAGLVSHLADVTVNGARDRRLPTHLHLAIGGVEAEALLLHLDREGVACSTGSACQSGAARRSHVLDAIAAREDAAHLRFTLGHATTPEEGLAARDRIEAAVDLLRRQAAEGPG